MKWKNVILDFDGTLVRTQSMFISAVNDLSEIFGYRRIEPDSQFRDKSLREVLIDVVGLMPEQIPIWGQQIKERAIQNIRNLVMVDKMGEVLSALQKDYRLGIVTSNTEGMVRYALNRTGIEHVDFIWADATMLEKNNAIQGALSKYALSLEETVYIGDESGDIDACRMVGISVIAVSWGFNSRAFLSTKEPDHLVDTPMQLLAALYRT